ncbi:DUF6547 family protein [Nigerium massiliense]|uniref:DUF6547 family protein n=1 Tax=Nigerium massiliense TaxID=1522317 RepID=UPI00058FB263|nr:DUF6547 family protein [Nigerium massiliense]
MSDDNVVLYRAIIDALVVQCREGEGQVSARRIQAGLWNENAEAAEVESEQPEQHAMNVLLGSLADEQRDVLAGLFAAEFESGVYNALRVLEAARVELFLGDETGMPTDHFLDRMDDGPWPGRS